MSATSSSPTKRLYSFDQFDVFEELGHGAYGAVYRGVDKLTKKQVAIKQVDLESDEDIAEFKNEIALLSMCNSDHITKYYGCFVKGFKLWIIMEFLPGGSLADLIVPGPFKESVISKICYELVLALNYLHETGKIHRDLKPGNILIGENFEVKIADFGVSTQLSNKLSIRNTYIGTPYYMAPEVILHQNYNFRADIWSLGITLLEIANGRPPLSEYHPMQVVYIIEKNQPPRLIGEEFSATFKDFIECCLQRDPNKRLSTKQLLKHKFCIKGSKVSIQEIAELVERRKLWNLENGINNAQNKKFYVSTIEKTNTVSINGDEVTEFDFDIETLKLGEHGNTVIHDDSKDLKRNTLKNVKKQDSTVKSEYFKTQKLRHDLSSILNASFNKISAKNNLTTFQYDNLVNFKTIFLQNMIIDENERNKELFQKFYKNLTKKIYTSSNPVLKEKTFPKILLENEKELIQLRKEKHQWENSRKLNNENENNQNQTHHESSDNFRKRDYVEELLLSRWAEGILEKYSE